METSIKKLVDSVISELIRLQYAKHTIWVYQTTYQKYIRYAENKEVLNHTIEFADKWLVEDCGIDIGKVELGGSPQPKSNFYHDRMPIRAMECLTDWQMHKYLRVKKSGKMASLSLCPSFQTGYDHYKYFCEANGFSESGTLSRLHRIKQMLLYFESQGIMNLEDIDASNISGFIKTRIGFESRTIASILSVMRCFFRQLFIETLIKKDFTSEIPHVKGNRKFKLPSVWKTEDVQ